MNKQEIFAAWAPDDGPWSPWVKPVLFSQIDTLAREMSIVEDAPIDVGFANDPDRATAVVVDLPGAQGVALGLRLAAIGYQPVPLYNACPSPVGEAAIVEVRPIIAAIEVGASQLAGVQPGSDARPAFLLDAKRNPAVSPAAGQFDNRSISLPTDFPSANLLLSCGIRRVLLVQTDSREPAADLAHTLRRWQDVGIAIFAVAIEKSDLSPQQINVARPKAYRVLWYNLLAKIGLKPSPLGGFGGVLPMPSVG